MNKLRTILSVLAIIVLTGCSNYGANSEIEALNEAKAVGSPFTQYLAAEYRDFANHKMDVDMDYPDAIHFARKGLATASGEVVMPEPISDWNLLPEHMTELGTARGRLIVAFDLGAREVSPELAAVAQARFDCWIEEQEEQWDADVTECKNQFMDAINALEGQLGPVAEPAPAPIEPVAQPVEPLEPEDAMYLVFFDFDQSNIGSGGDNVLDAVADEVSGRSLNIVNIIGHTDASGSNSYNNKLAMRRANAVRDALTSRGVDASLLNVTGQGEEQLLVDTEDGVREPANRRVEITFE